jgi:RHS repeat-associated protein
VERKYGYCGMNGRLSRLTTIFPEWVRGTPAQPVELSTSFVYDNFGRVKDIAYPLDGSSPRVPTTVTNTFVYGHLASVTSNRGSIVPSFNWNPAGGLEAVTSGNGVETSYGADILNRPQRIEVRYGATTYLDTGAFGYDGAGNVTELGADTYRYDLAGRLTSAQTSANHQAAETFDLSYTYDLLGSMTMFTKASGEDPNRITVGRSFEVDPSTNHLLTVDGAPVDYESGNLLFDGYLSFSWDKRSRLRSVGHQSQTLGEYDYDSGGVRVRKSDQTAFRTTYYVRGPGGEVLSEYSKPKDSTLEPHWNRDYVYMGRRLLAVVQNAKPLEPTGITSSASSTTVHLSWARNAEPDIYGYSVYRTTTVGAGYQKLNASLTILGTSFDDTSPLFSAPGVGVPTYYVITAVDSAGLESRYSAARLIIPADMTAPGAPTALSATAGDSTVTLSWTPNSEEDLAGYDVYRSTTSTVSGGVFGKLNITPLTSASFTDFGLTNGTTYYYKLKAVDTAANSSSFSVEVLAVPNSGGGGDPENPPPKEAHLRWDNPGGPTAPFASSPRFIGSHSAADADWEILFVHADHLGSTRVVTLEDGIVLATEHYFPFGESMPPQNPSRTGKGFTGHERDDEAGLYYMLARPYSPHLSRFPVPDPLGSIGQTGGPSSNAYTYALNNPTNYLDVDGREPTRCLFDPLPGLLPGLGGMDEGPKFPPVPSLTTIPFSSFTKEPTLCNMNPEGFCPNLGAGETAQPWLPEKPGAAMPLIETEVDYHPFGGALIRGLGRAGPSIARMAKRAFNAIKGWFRRGGTAELQSTVKISPKIARQMSARGWTREMIEEAIAKGQRIRAVNKATGGPATRYVHPKTGQSVVIDDVTGDVLHVGEPWFRYGPGSGDLP